MTNRLKISLASVAAALLWTLPAVLRADPSDSGGQSAGWSPQEANEWMVSQMKYAQAVKQYGKDSPEATQAQVLMNTLARDLGIPPTTAIPEQASMDTPTAPEPDADEAKVGRHSSKNQRDVPDIDPDRPQPAPQQIQQATEPVKEAEPTVESGAPAPAPVANDPPTAK